MDNHRVDVGVAPGAREMDFQMSYQEAAALVTASRRAAWDESAHLRCPRCKTRFISAGAASCDRCAGGPPEREGA